MPQNTEITQKLREICRLSHDLRNSLSDFCLYNINGMTEETDIKKVQAIKEQLFDIHSSLHNILLAEIFPTPKVTN